MLEILLTVISLLLIVFIAVVYETKKALIKALGKVPYDFRSAILTPIQKTISNFKDELKKIKDDLGMDDLHDKGE